MVCVCADILKKALLFKNFINFFFFLMIAEILHIVLKKALHFVLEMIIILSSFKTNKFMQLFDLYQQNTGHH